MSTHNAFSWTCKTEKKYQSFLVKTGVLSRDMINKAIDKTLFFYQKVLMFFTYFLKKTCKYSLRGASLGYVYCCAW